MNQLEEFIRAHRSEMDAYQPNKKTWEVIERTLPGKKIKYQIYWKIAAVVFFITSVYLGIAGKEILFISNQEIANSDFQSTETFYLNQIQERSNWLIQSGNPDVITQYKEMVALEAMYEVLHVKWLEHPEPFLEEAMKLNLIIRA